MAAQVDIRWRPSGGRGEYEHVPSDILLERRIAIEPVALRGSLITTDVVGLIRAGKPRLRRDDPNDRSSLNVAPLVAALALLPDPRREDPGNLSLPLQDKGYVVSSITMHVEHRGANLAVCTPLRLHVLHDIAPIDLFDRLRRIGEVLTSGRLPPSAAAAARDYLALVRRGAPSAEFRRVADELRHWLSLDSHVTEFIEEPASDFLPGPSAPLPTSVKVAPLSADETKRRLVSHFKIDRDPKIRRAKIEEFIGQHGDVYCENCRFSFRERYGRLGEGFIEVHHRKPLATLLPNEVTTLGDLMLLCANCHRIVHRRKPPLTPEGLSEITRL
jgi:hypothetical protein